MRRRESQPRRVRDEFAAGVSRESDLLVGLPVDTAQEPTRSPSLYTVSVWVDLSTTMPVRGIRIDRAQLFGANIAADKGAVFIAVGFDERPSVVALENDVQALT